MKRRKSPRCNYCHAPAVAWFSYMSYLAVSRQKWWKITVAACAQHEGCVNWNSLRELHPDAPVERAAGTK